MTAKRKRVREPVQKRKTGRPSDFKPEYVKQAYQLSLLGLTIDEMANVFGKATSTIKLWMSTHPAFSDAIKKGGPIADAEVADALRQNAKGFEHAGEKIFMTKSGRVVRAHTRIKYAPNPLSQFFWLKNRQPEKWRDRQIIDHQNSDGSFTKAYAEAMARSLGMNNGADGNEAQTTH